MTMNNIEFKGILAAPGMAEGPAVLFLQENLSFPRHTILDPDYEIARLKTAQKKARDEISQLKQKLVEDGMDSEAGVFEAHRMFLEDPSLQDMVIRAIQNGLNAEAAWMDGIDFFAQAISALPDETLSARSSDVLDVGTQVLLKLQGVSVEKLISLGEPSIILARDLTPSQTAGLDKKMIVGICTAEGGPTSHTAILSKALGIPALVGMGPTVLEIHQGTHVLLDASNGVLILNPDMTAQQSFRQRSGQAAIIKKIEHAESREPAVTKDGWRVEVVANVGSLTDAQNAVDNGAEGIGLLRTEFLYFDRQNAPEEQEQLKIYRSIFEVMGSRPIVVRTFDIGGDKELPYLPIGDEANPFLGWRAIRICLDQPEIFITQLRALLLASTGYDIRIMFPMIATLRELRTAKQIFLEARQEITSKGLPTGSHIQIGMMVETPSAAVMAEKFAGEVDFFSIGTNDLTQYTFAADRGNERVAHLSDPCHPAVLRQIKWVVEAGHARGIWVGICGEMGGDPESIPILLGLGLDELSVSPRAVPQTKAIVRRWTLSEAQRIAETALDLEDPDQVRDLVRSATANLS